MVGLIASFRNYDVTEDKQGTNSTTDVFSLLGKTCHSLTTNSLNICKSPCQGSILLWLYWPSFNALFAEADARHRLRSRNITNTLHHSLLQSIHQHLHLPPLGHGLHLHSFSHIWFWPEVPSSGCPECYVGRSVSSVCLSVCHLTCPVETLIITLRLIFQAG